MGLRDIKVKAVYYSDEDDLLIDFYIPVLSNSVKYDRIASYFSSNSLAIAAKGIAALSNENSEIVEKYRYDVFGGPTIRDSNNTIISQSSIANPYMFTSRRFDTESALYYYRARYYAYDIGRFLQTDPIGYDDGLNMYSYCGNNSTNWVDPYGLCKGAPGKAWDEVQSGWNWWGNYVRSSDALTSLGAFGYGFLGQVYDIEVAILNPIDTVRRLPDATKKLYRDLQSPDPFTYGSAVGQTTAIAEAVVVVYAFHELALSLGQPGEQSGMEQTDKPSREYRHDTPPSKPKYDKNTKKREPDHWHYKDWNWSPDKKKWLPGKWKYYGPEKPPDAPPNM